MCWKHDWIELKNLEKSGRRLEGLEILSVLREFLDHEARPRLETAGEHLGRAGFRAQVRPVACDGASPGLAGEGLLLEIRSGFRSLVSPMLWFRVMVQLHGDGDEGARPERVPMNDDRVSDGASRRAAQPTLAVLYSQSFGGEHEEGIPLGLTAPARLDDQLHRFLVQGELRGG